MAAWFTRDELATMPLVSTAMLGVRLAYVSPMHDAHPDQVHDAWSWLLSILGSPPQLLVHRDRRRHGPGAHGWAFRTTFTRGDVEAVAHAPRGREHRRARLAGRWLVNGAHRPIASVHARTAARGPACSASRCTLRELLVSVDDVAELRARAS